LLVTFRAYR